MAFYDSPGVTYDSGIFYDGFVPPQPIGNTMAKVKLNLAGLSVAQKIELAKKFEEMMTGNTNFTTPDPELTVLATKYGALDDANTSAEAARAASVEATTNLYDAEKELDVVLNALAAYVEKASGGDTAKIQSAGMSVRAERTPTTDLPAVQSLSLTAGDNDGEIDGGFDRVVGAKSYEIQSCVDPITPTGWTHRDIVTQSKFTLSGLTSGTRTWIRVRAVGPKRIKGAWSDPAVKIVP